MPELWSSDWSGRAELLTRRRRACDGREAVAAPGRAQPTARRGAPTSDTTLDGVRFEYNPGLDGDADPGEVVWTWVPWEEDPTQGKDRPVVIIGRRGSTLVGVPLTSKAHDREPQVLVGTGPWDRDGRPSYAKLDRVLEVDAAQVRREGRDPVSRPLRRLGSRPSRPLTQP